MQGSKPCALPLGDTPIICKFLIHPEAKNLHPCDVLRILQRIYDDVNFRKQINY
ncbi:protein of unknown function [Legionella fallonii LLAP-10]|uniref:Uncharacterized protein n=1 Tax=Legionella fallonii LLAP-10 TaxID=1212491 RepID=A0A098G339_9GAMM|nr:protein of unknown function [Legionella fallonii LLAP-10]